jgi:putative hydrolase of the HAD superfamily
VPVKALLFDLDNTLYPSSSPMTAELSRRITGYVGELKGVGWEEASRLRREGFARYGTTLKWLEAEEGFSDHHDFLKQVHPPDVAPYLSPDPGLPDLLSSLDYPKYILTNSSADHAARVLDHLGIADHFLAVYDITYNRMTGKPHPSAYRRLLAELPWEPGEILFIDDVPQYLDGFARMGGRCLLIDETGRHPDAPFARISSIHELPRILAGPDFA